MARYWVDHGSFPQHFIPFLDRSDTLQEAIVTAVNLAVLIANLESV